MSIKTILSTCLGVVFFSTIASAQKATPTPSPTPTPTPPPLLVYDLKVETTGRNLNPASFKDGYLVVDLDAAIFSSIVVLTDPGSTAFYQAADYVTGKYNELIDYDGRRNAFLFGAVSASSANADNAALQLTGLLDRIGKVGLGTRAEYANKLRGYMLYSAPEIKGKTTNGKTTGFFYGFAGFAKAFANFNKNLTKEVNTLGLDTTDAIDFLEKQLFANGIPGPTPTPKPAATK